MGYMTQSKPNLQSQTAMVHNHQGRIITSNQSNNSFKMKPDDSALTSQRDKYKKSQLNNFGERLKKSTRKSLGHSSTLFAGNASRRIQISYDKNSQMPTQQIFDPGMMQSQENLQASQQMIQISNQKQQPMNRITSTERHQKNNISSANPKKAMVTPRQKDQFKAYKQSQLA